jgi:hypothetical protein
MSARNHYESARWFELKDLVKHRARRRCEYCCHRPVNELHHRTYANVGHEPPRDVMGVCFACHRLIHGRPTANRIVFRRGSLLDQGDTGMGTTAQWEDYLLAWEARKGGL